MAVGWGQEGNHKNAAEPPNYILNLYLSTKYFPLHTLGEEGYIWNRPLWTVAADIALFTICVLTILFLLCLNQGILYLEILGPLVQIFQIYIRLYQNMRIPDPNTWTTLADHPSILAIIGLLTLIFKLHFASNKAKVLT